MKFEYLKQPNFSNANAPWVSRPFIPIQIPRNTEKVDVLALVDSGADSSLFHSSLAELLGIELKKGRQQKFFGIAGAGIDVYFHKVKLKLVGGAESIVIDAGFTESNGVGAILGQSDFFEH